MRIKEFTARGANLLVKRISLGDRSEGGLYLPEVSDPKKASSFAVVVRVGPDVEGIEVNDYVVVSQYDGRVVKDLEGEFLVVPDEQVLLHHPADDLDFVVTRIETHVPFTGHITTKGGIARFIQDVARTDGISEDAAQDFVMSLRATPIDEDAKSWGLSIGEGDQTLADLLAGP